MPSSHLPRLQRCETQLRDFLEEALRGVPPEKVLEPPASGKWSAHENLAHLARYHEIFLQRVTRILHEDRPVFGRYRAEEDPEWESRKNRSHKEVVASLASCRKMLMSKLKSLTDEDYQRTGIHPRLGEMSLTLWLEFFLVHEAHHLYVAFALLRS